MAIRMGLSPESINRHPESEALWKSGRFPKAPTILQTDFKTIVEYYKNMIMEAENNTNCTTFWRAEIITACGNHDDIA